MPGLLRQQIRLVRLTERGCHQIISLYALLLAVCASQLTQMREMVYTDLSPQRPLVACTLGPVPRRAFVLSWQSQYSGFLIWEQLFLGVEVYLQLADTLKL